MAQGNPNKVNAIVDEIVENNNVFKLKSPIEQDKEKDSIAQSINSAISVLNEVGKELVLQELSVDPDEKFKGFIDSVGNIDISGLTQMATTIVNAKIEEAEREGIDLRQGQPVFKENSKTLLAEGILTVAIIDTMIKNYEELSNIDKDALARNWNNMLPEQKREYATALGNALKRKAATIEDPNIKNQILEAEQEVRKMPDNEELYNQKLNNMTDEQLQEYVENLYGKNSSLSSLTPEKQREKLQGEFNIRNEKAIIAVQSYENNENPSQIEDIKKASSSYRCNKFAMLGTTKSIPISIEEFSQKSPNEQEAIIYYIENSLSMPLDEFLEDKKHSEPKFDSAKKVKKTDKKILQEIEQLPSALAKANFSQEDILEAMKQYRDYISNYSEISEVVADNIKKLDSDDIVLNIQDDFNSLNGDGQINSNVHKILNILAQVNYGSSMQQILTNSEVREQFLAQFDKVIEQGINLEQDVKLDGELAQIFSQYFKDNAEEMDISAIEEQKEQVTDEQVKQEEPKEMFSFIDSEYLKQDSIEGLIPRNGENSQSLQDDKKAIFYSQGKEGAIVMYFEFLKQYEKLKGFAGDKALEQYANYKNGTIELSDEQVQLLQGQLKQITQMRETKDFDEFMGDKLYLKLNGIDTEQDRQTAEEWRASHPGTRMDYNYANSWTNSAISPDRIDVISLQSKDGKDVRTSQKDLIKYFLSQTSIDKIEELGVNDTTLENIRKYYQEHSAEIAQMGEEYSVVTQNIQEFEQSRESKETEKQSETRETEITAPEIEKHEENLPAKQDNSFLGKIKRVFANMKDMKNKDNSKGFFARLGASIQTVFGNKKDEFDEKQDENITLNSTQRKEQTREDSKQTNYLTQHFDVNEKQAVQDLKKKQDSKDKDSQLSQDDQEFGNL